VSKSATIESKVPSLAELAPLVMALPHTDKAWFHAITHKIADAWVNINGCGDNVIHHNDTPIDFGTADATELSLESLLDTRTQRIS
jgi:hypothetical protein